MQKHSHMTGSPAAHAKLINTVGKQAQAGREDEAAQSRMEEDGDLRYNIWKKKKVAPSAKASLVGFP